MTIVDRYLLFQFFKIFLVCFVSFSGLYVVIHVFTNLDEVVEITGQSGGTKTLIVDFYGPRVLDFFNRTSGILILVSAVFAIALMQRRREATATEAAGITKWRLARPIIFASIFVIGLAAVSRELYIPKYKAMLVRTLTNWTATGSVPMHQFKDLETGILVKGDELILSESQITDIQLTLPRSLRSEFIDIKAESGIVMSADPAASRPAGVLLNLNIEPQKILESDSIRTSDGKTIVFSSKEYPWLNVDEIFVACHLNIEEIAYGSNLGKYSSLNEMIEALKKPSHRFGLGDQVAIHGRIIQPVLELTMLLVGLPVVVCNPNRNIFLGAGICTAVIMMIQLTTVATHTLGAYRMVQPAALAVWIPVLLFLPMSAFTIRKLFD